MIRDLGRENDDRLPKCPIVTQEQLREIDAEQRKRARRIDTSIERRALQRAFAVIDELEKLPREDFSVKQLERYVEALCTAGKYNEAYELTGDDRYKIIWDTVWDSKDCDCEDLETVELVNGKVTPKVYSRHFKKATIYSLKEEGFVALKCCNKCGHLSI